MGFYKNVNHNYSNLNKIIKWELLKNLLFETLIIAIFAIK